MLAISSLVAPCLTRGWAFLLLPWPVKVAEPRVKHGATGLCMAANHPSLVVNAVTIIAR